MLKSLRAPLGTALETVESDLEWVRRVLRGLRETEKHMKSNLDTLAEECDVKTISSLELNLAQYVLTHLFVI